MKNFHQHNRNDKRPFGGRDSGKRSMHRATCDECGQDCEVPFKPSGDKPIYCSNCFGENKSSDYGRPARRDSGRSAYPANQMFAAVCDECGQACEVPFKPSGGKPVFCHNCFGQKRAGGVKTSGPSKEQFVIINAKLDKILLALSPAFKEDVPQKPDKKTAVVTPKNAAGKKPLKQKKTVAAAKSRKKKK